MYIILLLLQHADGHTYAKCKTHPLVSFLPARVLLLHKVPQIVVIVEVEQRHKLLQRVTHNTVGSNLGATQQNLTIFISLLLLCQDKMASLVGKRKLLVFISWKGMCKCDVVNEDCLLYHSLALKNQEREQYQPEYNTTLYTAVVLLFFVFSVGQKIKGPFFEVILSLFCTEK